MNFFIFFKNKMSFFISNNQGVTAIEYAIMTGGVAMIVTTFFTNGGMLEETMLKVFEQISTTLSNVIQ